MAYITVLSVLCFVVLVSGQQYCSSRALEDASPDAVSGGFGSCPFAVYSQTWQANKPTAMELTLADGADDESMFQMFLVSVQHKNRLVGEMNLISSSAELTCLGTSIKNKDLSDKSSVQFTWTPPADIAASDTLIIRYSVGETPHSVWVDCGTEYLMPSPISSTANTSSATTITTATTTVASTTKTTTTAATTTATTKSVRVAGPDIAHDKSSVVTIETTTPTTQSTKTSGRRIAGPDRAHDRQTTTNTLIISSSTTQRLAPPDFVDGQNTARPSTHSSTSVAAPSSSRPTSPSSTTTSSSLPSSSSSEPSSTTQKQTESTLRATTPTSMPASASSTTRGAQVMSDSCIQGEITYSIVPNTNCTKFQMQWLGGRSEMSCPRGLKFRIDSCTCAYAVRGAIDC